MSDTLRILLLVSAVLTGGWILYKIRKLQVKMQDAIFWMVFAAILFILGIFPQACYWLTERLGIQSPANLVFLVIIFLLMEKVFTLSIIVSQQEEKISVLSAEIALRSNDASHRLDEAEKHMEKFAEDTAEDSVSLPGNLSEEGIAGTPVNGKIQEKADMDTENPEKTE